MEQDPTNRPPQETPSDDRQWFEIGVQPEGVDDDIWTGSPTQDDDFDPEMFNKPRKPLEPKNWTEVGIRPDNYDDDTWSGGGNWDAE